MEPDQNNNLLEDKITSLLIGIKSQLIEAFDLVKQLDWTQVELRRKVGNTTYALLSDLLSRIVS